MTAVAISISGIFIGLALVIAGIQNQNVITIVSDYLKGNPHPGVTSVMGGGTPETLGFGADVVAGLAG